MAVPKKKKSSSRTRMGRSHLSLDKVNIIKDKQSGDDRRSHHIGSDGMYNGRQIIIKRANKSEDENAV